MNNPSPKTKAIIAYLTFIGLLIAYSMNQDKKDAYTTFHIKNMFALLLILLASLTFQNYILGFYLYWVAFILWIYSLIMAITHQKKGIPFLDKKFESWFKFLG